MSGSNAHEFTADSASVDTSSEIALLSVSALAQTSAGGGIAQSEILILPMCFTAGMSLVDTLDSILMLWGYAMPEQGEENWKRIWRNRDAEITAPPAEQPGTVLPALESQEKGIDENPIKDAPAKEKDDVGSTKEAEGPSAA